MEANKMKKSTIITLIVSVCLIALGFVLVGCGIAAGYENIQYHFGRTVYFQSSFVSNTLESRLLTSFGQMSFILGIAGLFLFAYLAVKNPKEKKEKAAEAKDRKVPAPELKTEEVKSEETASCNDSDNPSSAE